MLLDAVSFLHHPEGAGLQQADRVDFGRSVLLEFRSTQLSSDGGLEVMSELDDELDLFDLMATALRDTRRRNDLRPKFPPALVESLV
jgi:hypothetical protein